MASTSTLGAGILLSAANILQIAKSYLAEIRKLDGQSDEDIAPGYRAIVNFNLTLEHIPAKLNRIDYNPVIQPATHDMWLLIPNSKIPDYSGTDPDTKKIIDWLKKNNVEKTGKDWHKFSSTDIDGLYEYPPFYSA